MATFESYKEIISELQKLSTGIESGQLTESDLQRFVDLSQKLYERSIILNFKAMESKVFEVKKVTEVAAKEPIVETPKPEPVVISKEPKEEPSILFDFSSDQEDVKQEVSEPISAQEIVEEEIIEEEQQRQETIIEQKVTTVSNDEVQSFYQRFTKVHNDSLNDHLSNSKIESLKGAFGLNDRMRIISDLFNGDNDAFSTIISELDGFNSGEMARKKLSEIAVSRRWDVEDKLVEEFVKTVNRKFD